jgi:hypothetical protein
MLKNLHICLKIHIVMFKNIVQFYHIKISRESFEKQKKCIILKTIKNEKISIWLSCRNVI